MMMGPEPIIRIFLMSVRLGMLASLPGGPARVPPWPFPQYSFPSPRLSRGRNWRGYADFIQFNG
jgi:hypothetical protein